MNSLASSGVVTVVFVGINLHNLVSRSTITQMASWPCLVLGKPTIKTIKILSHLPWGISNGCKSPPALRRLPWDALPWDALPYWPDIFGIALHNLGRPCAFLANKTIVLRVHRSFVSLVDDQHLDYHDTHKVFDAVCMSPMEHILVPCGVSNHLVWKNSSIL